MERAVALIQLLRPINCLVMGFAVIVGIVVAIPIFPFREDVMINGLLSFTTAFTFLAAANVVNDYHDRNIDAINKPNNPIPSGIVHPSEALGYAFILSLTGFITALLTNVSCLIVAAIAWILFMTYATMGKRTGLMGNFMVSACMAIPFIYGGLAVEKGLNLALILFSTMAFLSSTGREVTKGIVDVQGDRLHGVKTIAVLYGSRTSAIAAVSFYVASVVLSFLPSILGIVHAWYLPLVILADGGFVFSSVSLLGDYSRENARRVKNLVRLWMVIGLLAFIAGKL